MNNGLNLKKNSQSKTKEKSQILKTLKEKFGTGRILKTRK